MLQSTEFPGRVSRLLSVVFAIALMALAAPAASAQTLLANVAANYRTSGTISDSYGSGVWNYYASTTVNPNSGTLTGLTYRSVGNGGNMGYGYAPSGSYSVPAVSNGKLFVDGATPIAGTELAWHPNNGSPVYTVLRWTAGAGEAGTATIAGYLSKTGEPGGTVDFHVFVNGVEELTFSSLTGTTSQNFSVARYVNVGDTISFVLGNGSNGYGGDESRISATITSSIPEPATVAALCGVVALGAVAWRRRSARR